MTTTYAPRIAKLEPSGDPYTTAYRRGWNSAERGSEGALDRADLRNEPDAWYDGYADSAAGRPKYTLRSVRRAVVQGMARYLNPDERELVRDYYASAQVHNYDRAAIFGASADPEPATHDVVIEHDADRGYPWRARCRTCDWRSWYYASQHAAEGMADDHRNHPEAESPAGGWVADPEPTAERPRYDVLDDNGDVLESFESWTLACVRLRDWSAGSGHGSIRDNDTDTVTPNPYYIEPDDDDTEPETYELMVCECCLCKLANDEPCQCDDDPRNHPHGLAAFRSYDHAYIVPCDLDDCEDFSRAQCRGCGSCLAGARYPVTVTEL